MMKKMKRYGLWLTFSLLFLGCAQRQLVLQVDTSKSSMPIDGDQPEDKAIQAMIAPYKTKLDAEMTAVIGKATMELDKGKVESPLGNFTADLMQAEAEIESGRKVDMGAITTGGLRTPIKKGEIMMQDIFELMPFENQVMLLTLDSALVIEMFHYLYERKNLAVSNSIVVYGQNGEIASLVVGGAQLAGDRDYMLSISDYLANGGDDMLFLRKAPSEMLRLKVRDAIIRHIRGLTAQGKEVTADYEGRVLIADQ